MFSLLHILSYVGGITAFVFVTLSLASGLLWLAELIEEHSRIAKVVGIRAIYAIMVLHVLLYITDGLPLLPTLFSIACHAVYRQHFSSRWPFISLTSPVFLLSCVLVVADHFLWFFHFAGVAQEAKKYRASKYRYSANTQPHKDAPTFLDVAVFFAICVWFIPLFLFLSLSANDNVIPSFDTSAPPSPARGAIDISSPGGAKPSRTVRSSSSLVKSVLTPIVNLIPHLGRKSRDAEGLIAPRAGSPLPPSANSTSYFPWGADASSASTSPSAFYPPASVPDFSLRGHTPPPPRRIPSEPPRSRSSISSEVDDASIIPPPKSTVGGPTGRRSPARSRTMPIEALSDGGSKSKAD
ncbi:Protein SVP26 [Vanrija pseudolonga]|uniref:Protein SVP26 n=1 Tax=Vanrija pseudolonga TaxID=143232 RepID=A0AAF0Y3K7_9TREE|nr:Protein SVP26 [Vanrija pseudolonga]